MKKLGKIWFICAFLVFIAFMAAAVQTFKPIRNVQPDEVMEITKKVIEIKEGSGYDIIIALENDHHQYYINRGLELGFTVEQLNTSILNKTVTLYCIERWTIFTPDKVMGHISKILAEDKVIFNEINNDIHEKTTSY